MNINFDKIKEKIDRATVFTVKKAGEVASLTKLTLKKTEAKAKLSDAYKELGELIYLNSKEESDIEERFNFLISKIDEIQEEIEKYSEAADEIKD